MHRRFTLPLGGAARPGLVAAALDEALVARRRRLDDVSPTPGEEDTFTGGTPTFGFERDRNGLVIGFYLSNGRTRNVRFERQR